MVAQILERLLFMVRILQRTDLVGEFVGHTGPKMPFCDSQTVSDGGTPLQCAAAHGRKEALQMLLDRKANVYHNRRLEAVRIWKLQESWISNLSPGPIMLCETLRSTTNMSMVAEQSGDMSQSVSGSIFTRWGGLPFPEQLRRQMAPWTRIKLFDIIQHGSQSRNMWILRGWRCCFIRCLY
ncbi:uncharacterized protein LOC131315229 [Rhododendron vialii]|uniref:uncharacterized protein LOC131315229 n=1 Tax=Rhododendron vialii TaxID=182163 RepID=UPI00265ECF9F|nr:uncharacterized protein LOC131315229 [Rhododendron vialii]